jgi:molecular chaperone GrpE
MKKDKKKEKKVNREQELKDRLARALADYDNLRKRTEKEKEEIIKLANLSFFLRLAPIIDNLKKAKEHLKDPGLENIVKELLEIISEEGLEIVKAEKDTAFDENFHEATDIEPVDNKEKSGKIARVTLEGWRVKDGPVIRPAKVVVYKTKED